MFPQRNIAAVAPPENSPMRSLALAAVAAVSFAAPPAAQARLFWQTYGSTVATADGCAWNLSSDYFVPRHCDSCRYGLFSPCKTAHSISPACWHLHPVYGGYCTPYASCHYRWRDHVYKKYCCCSPLRYVHGPWKLEKCRKHCGALHGGCGSLGGGCAGGYGGVGPFANCPAGTCPSTGDCSCCGEYAGALMNVEPLGGETLGEIAAMPANMVGASGAGLMGGASPTLPPLPALPMPGGPASGLPIPGLLGR